MTPPAYNGALLMFTARNIGQGAPVKAYQLFEPARICRRNAMRHLHKLDAEGYIKLTWEKGEGWSARIVTLTEKGIEYLRNFEKTMNN